MLKSTNILKVLLCLALIAAIAGCAGGPKQQSTGEYIDDSAITAKVKAALLDEPLLRSFQIEVKTYDGIVQLSGFVNRQDQVTKAGEVTRSVTGVKDVKNSLLVKPQ